MRIHNWVKGLIVGAAAVVGAVGLSASTAQEAQAQASPCIFPAWCIPFEPPKPTPPPKPSDRSWSVTGVDWFTGTLRYTFSGERESNSEKTITWVNRPWVEDETTNPYSFATIGRVAGQTATPAPSSLFFRLGSSPQGDWGAWTPMDPEPYIRQWDRTQSTTPGTLRGSWPGICSLITEEEQGYGDFVASWDVDYGDMENLYDFAVSRVEWFEKQYGMSVPRSEIEALFPKDVELNWDLPSVSGLAYQVQALIGPYQAEALARQSATLNYSNGIRYKQKDFLRRASGSIYWSQWKEDFTTTWNLDEAANEWKPSTGGSGRYTINSGTARGTSPEYVYKRVLGYDWEGGTAFGENRGATECLFPPKPYIVTQTCVASYGPVRVTGPVGVGVNPEYNRMGRKGQAYKSKSSNQTLTNGGNAWRVNTSFGNWYKNNYNGLNLNNEAQNGAAMNQVRGAGCNESANVPVPVRQTVEMYGGGKFKISTTKSLVKCNYWFYPYYNTYRLISCAPSGTSVMNEYVERECNGSTSGISKAAFDAGRTSGQSYALSKCYNFQCIWSRDGSRLNAAQLAVEPQTYEDTDTGGKNLIYNPQRLYTVQGDGRRITVDFPSLRMIAIDNSGRALPTSTTAPIPKYTVWSVREGSLPWSTELGLDQRPNDINQVFAGRVNGDRKLWVEKYDNLGLMEEDPRFVDAKDATIGWDDTGANTLNLSFFQPSPGTNDRFVVQGYFQEVKTAPISYYSVTRINPSGTNQGQVRILEDDLIFQCTAPQPTSFRAVGGRNTTGR